MCEGKTRIKRLEWWEIVESLWLCVEGCCVICLIMACSCKTAFVFRSFPMNDYILAIPLYGSSFRYIRRH